jgi:anti-sigma factor ChrR (cupin superfamily)
MLVNADFSQPAVVTPEEYRWVPSPQAGVERVMLDRVGGEKARATSLVRYAPESHFPPHLHGGGEEILVLSGTFSDDAGDYPAGWYLRNPPGSMHRPASREGAMIFVKLWQMPASESAAVRVDTRDPARWSSHGGRETCELYQGPSERVVIERLASGQRVFDGEVQGAEILVLAGELRRGDERLVEGTWMRLPPGAWLEFLAAVPATTVYVKTGHLANPCHCGLDPQSTHRAAGGMDPGSSPG